jgi:hypothetical protein
MDLARLRSNINLVPVLAILAATSPWAMMATAAPPSSELNGVAKITPAPEVDVPVVIDPIDPVDAEVAPASPGVIVEISEPPIAVTAVDETSGSSTEPVRPAMERADATIVDSGPLALEHGEGMDSAAATDSAAQSATAAVLSTAGEIASFDRTPIFGRSGEASNGTAPGTPTISTTGGGNAGSWWNAPELRVFGLLAVLVLAAVFMKRHGGRGIGLAGGPRPSGVVSVLGRFPFGRSASLVLLECGPKVLLLHQHAGKGGEVATLAEFSDLDEVADLRRRLSATERDAKGGFGRELEQTLGLYDRRGRPRGFNGEDGLPVQGPIETVDLTRRRPRRGVRGNG